MKRFKVTKLVWADSIQDVIDIDKVGAIMGIDIIDEVTSSDEIGFRKTYGENTSNGQGVTMVPKIRKGSRGTKSPHKIPKN